jgi:peptidoglycan hydrolase CwlO-like protein
MTPEKNSEIMTGFSAIQTYIIGLDNTCDYLLKKVDDLNFKIDDLDHLDGKVDKLSDKFADLDSKFDDLDSKFDDLDIDDISDKLDSLDSKVDNLDHLDGKVDELSEKIDDIETTISDSVSDYIAYNFKLSDHIDTAELVEAASDCIKATINTAVGRATTPALMADAVSTAIRSDPCILDEFFKTHAGKSLLIDSLTELLLKGK